MAAMEGKIAALEGQCASINVELAKLQHNVAESVVETNDNILKQNAAMNLVVEEARQEFQKMTANIRQVVADSTAEFGSIKESCAEFGKRVENVAQKVDTEKEGIKAVVTQVAQGHAQELGAMKQKIADSGIQGPAAPRAHLTGIPEGLRGLSRPRKHCRRNVRALQGNGWSGKTRWKIIATCSGRG